MTLHSDISADRASQRFVPRAEGRLELSVKRRAGTPLSVLDRFRASGAYKALFPPARANFEAIVLNTSGGATGGDSFALTAKAGEGAQLTLTTQAAERAYRAASGTAQMTAHLTAAADARLQWLPQELILYDGAALHRKLTIDLAATAGLLMVEPLIFGRAAMGETLQTGLFQDRIRISRAGQPLYADGMTLRGKIAQHLGRLGTAQGAGAMASVVYVGPDAEHHLSGIRSSFSTHADTTGGASLRAPDMLVGRILARDSMALRAALVPVLDRLSQNTLPRSWRL